MKLRVIVEVVDEASRKGTRRRKEIEIPERIINVNKVLCESRKELREFLADDVMSQALRTVSIQQNATDKFSEALSEDVSPQREGGDVKSSKLDDFLGLSVIQNIDKLELSQKGSQNGPTLGVPLKEKEFNWGKIGFGPDKER